MVSSNDDLSVIELEGAEPVHVRMSTEELVRMINEKNRIGIGFRTNANS